MRKINESEFNEVDKTECVEIRVCTKTRKCGWKGTYPELESRRISNIESEHICPECGNNEFYVEWMPTDRYKDRYVKP